jgi:dTDP-4-amino-4,6-dideoxygalactose transaminase
VAHLYGVPVDLDAVRATAGPDVLLIEDAAQGAGILRRGRPAGALGQLGVLSFGRGKGITGGGGGALLVNDARLDQAFRQVVDGVGDGRRGTILGYGKLKAQWLLGRPWLYAIPANLPFLGLGETVYRLAHEPAGISALAAGTLSRTILLARAEAEVRRRNAAAYVAAFAGVDGVEALPSSVPESWTPGWLRFPVLLREHRAADLRALRRLGVERGYPSTLAGLPGFGERRLDRGRALPGAALLSRSLLTLPTHGFVKPRDRERLVSMLGGRPWPAP